MRDGKRGYARDRGGRLLSLDDPTPEGTFADASRFRLRLSLESTPAERLRDLEAMIDFNETVEALNPDVRWVADELSARKR